MIDDVLCDFCENDVFEYRGKQKVDDINELDMYVCNKCQGKEIYMLSGERVTEDNYNILIKKPHIYI